MLPNGLSSAFTFANLPLFSLAKEELSLISSFPSIGGLLLFKWSFNTDIHVKLSRISFESARPTLAFYHYTSTSLICWIQYVPLSEISLFILLLFMHFWHLWHNLHCIKPYKNKGDLTWQGQRLFTQLPYLQCLQVSKNFGTLKNYMYCKQKRAWSVSQMLMFLIIK